MTRQESRWHGQTHICCGAKTDLELPPKLTQNRSCQETLIFAYVLFVMCMGLCVKTEADNIPVDLGEMVVDSLGNDDDGQESRVRRQNRRWKWRKITKIRKKTWSFRALKTNFSRGDKGGQNGENPSVNGGLMMFLHTWNFPWPNAWDIKIKP